MQEALRGGRPEAARPVPPRGGYPGGAAAARPRRRPHLQGVLQPRAASTGARRAGTDDGRGGGKAGRYPGRLNGKARRELTSINVMVGE